MATDELKVERSRLLQVMYSDEAFPAELVDKVRSRGLNVDDRTRPRHFNRARFSA